MAGESERLAPEERQAVLSTLQELIQSGDVPLEEFTKMVEDMQAGRDNNNHSSANSRATSESEFHDSFASDVFGGSEFGDFASEWEASVHDDDGVDQQQAEALQNQDDAVYDMQDFDHSSGSSGDEGENVVWPQESESPFPEGGFMAALDDEIMSQEEGNMVVPKDDPPPRDTTDYGYTEIMSQEEGNIVVPEDDPPPRDTTDYGYTEIMSQEEGNIVVPEDDPPPRDTADYGYTNDVELDRERSRRRRQRMRRREESDRLRDPTTPRPSRRKHVGRSKSTGEQNLTPHSPRTKGLSRRNSDGVVYTLEPTVDEATGQMRNVLKKIEPTKDGLKATALGEGDTPPLMTSPRGRRRRSVEGSRRRSSGSKGRRGSTSERSRPMSSDSLDSALHSLFNKTHEAAAKGCDDTATTASESQTFFGDEAQVAAATASPSKKGGRKKKKKVLSGGFRPEDVAMLLKAIDAGIIESGPDGKISIRVGSGGRQHGLHRKRSGRSHRSLTKHVKPEDDGPEENRSVKSAPVQHSDRMKGNDYETSPQRRSHARHRSNSRRSSLQASRPRSKGRSRRKSTSSSNDGAADVSPPDESKDDEHAFQFADFAEFPFDL